MPNITTFSVLHEKVKKLKEDLSLSDFSSAFTRYALEIIIKLNNDDIEESITDGPDDGGIDAIYIKDREVHLFSFTYTDNVDNSDKNYPGNDIDKIIVTTSQILSKQLNTGLYNDAIKDKYGEILAEFDKGKTTTKLYLVSNKKHPVDSEKKKLASQLSQFRFIEIRYFDLNDLVGLLLENRTNKIDGDLNFIDKQHFEKSDGNIKTIIGVMPAIDLINIISDKEKKTIPNEAIFNDNIRVYKPQHSINKSIKEAALSENNFQFFYLNNGITILCEECDYTPHQRAPKLHLKNLQIINGGQTSHSLFEVYKKSPDKLNNIELLIRICVTKKENPISELISETTNSQIPVVSRDLRSNDLIQKKLELDFSTLGYFYERKPNQYSDKPKTQILNNELLAQLFMSFHLDKPSEAKNTKSLIFGELYDDIFDENVINAKYLLSIFKLYQPLFNMKQSIQRKKRRREPINEKEAFISRATFHILTAMKHVAINEKKDVFLETEYTFLKDKAIEFISQIVEKEMVKRGEVYTHDKFFKEIPTNKILIDQIKEFYMSSARPAQ